MKAVLIETVADSYDDYTVSELDLPDEGRLDAMQALLGGYVGIVPIESESVTLWVNDEGKYAGFDRNYAAEFVWRLMGDRGCLDSGDWIAGPLLVTGGANPEGETQPVPDDFFDLLTRAMGGGQ